MYFPIAYCGVYAGGLSSKLRVVCLVFFLYIQRYAVFFSVIESLVVPFASAFLFPEQAANSVAAMRESAMDSFFIFISMWVSVCKCSDFLLITPRKPYISLPSAYASSLPCACGRSSSVAFDTALMMNSSSDLGFFCSCKRLYVFFPSGV